MINELRKSNHFHGEEILRLVRDLSMTKIFKSAMNIQFDHAEKRVYKIGFEKCRALVIQMWTPDKAQLLQVPVEEQPLAADLTSTSRGPM